MSTVIVPSGLPGGIMLYPGKLDPHTFEVPMGGIESTDDIADSLRRRGVEVDPRIKQSNFPITRWAERAKKTMGLVNPPLWEHSEDEGRYMLRHERLLDPSHEDALYFVYWHVDATALLLKPYILFLLRRTWVDPATGERRMMCLRCRGTPRLALVEIKREDKKAISIWCSLAGFFPPGQ